MVLKGSSSLTYLPSVRTCLLGLHQKLVLAQNVAGTVDIGDRGLLTAH